MAVILLKVKSDYFEVLEVERRSLDIIGKIKKKTLNFPMQENFACINSFKKEVGARKWVQWLKAHILAEDLGLNPSSHVVPHSHP